ncbi:heavy-metal-associated domain-containing protein [Helicovermis profundi]|uniref:HMA domain-containing protein n=1 Tax=Helicovermis profundi TaxID=3065157 RepID=A0AAU9EET3_9FIRM|nr:hypothetical protein HLPR_22900 [Clostridia bacterium S502]
MKKTITINGMSCHHCEMRVENALKELNIDVISVSASENNAIVELSDDFDTKKIAETIDDVGYEMIDIKS